MPIFYIRDADGNFVAVPAIKGEKGDTGDTGPAPVRGVDYWTAEDVAEIQQHIDEQISASHVQSINGKTGVVELTADDVGALSSDTEIPIIDSTLTQSGQAADAKVTGDALSEINTTIVQHGESITTLKENGLPEVTSTNQQLVTDADGNVVWEERLGYKDWDYVEQTDVPVGIYTLGYGSLPFEFFPVEGEEYTVTLDGTAYTCSATIITIDDENVTVVGSTTFFGGTVDPDIPVAICCRSGRATVYANESGDHTIGITGYVKNPKKISREYIDWNPVVGVIDSHYYNYRYLNESRGASIAEIRKAAADKNKDIIIRLDLDTWQGTMRYLGLVNVSTDGSTYKPALLFNVIKSENASINISDETIDGNMQLEYWYTFLEPAESLEANAFISCQFGKVDLTDVALKSDVDQSITQLSEEIVDVAAAKLSLPSTDSTPDYGTAGQFAVSDGNGGITWQTLYEAEEVSY